MTTPQFLLSTTLYKVGIIFVQFETDVVRARNLGSLLAQEMFFDKTSSIRIGTAISELSRNMIEHSNGGTIEFFIAKSKEKTGIVVVFKDEGNGIVHLDEIKNGTYKSEKGMGVGLTGSQRLMDDFEIKTTIGLGTEITVTKWLPKYVSELTISSIEQIIAAFATTIERGELSMVDTINAQNKELLYLLKSIQERNEEIESINKELEETNRGVLALNRELQDNTLSIENAKKIAEQANKAKSDFLAHMSHEIRTPMNAILGFTDLLLKTNLNKIQKNYAENIDIAGKALLEIINDILDLSKIEAGKLELEIVITDLWELLDQVIEIIRISALNKKLDLLLTLQPGLPQFITVDPVRLKQILINLTANAIKFTEKGFVEIIVNYKLISSSECKIDFVVKDTGIGICNEQKSRLFKAFSQADTSTTRKFGGTGLGLVISNLLARKMNSFIEFESEPGSGSKFYFSLQTNLSNQTEFNPNNQIKKILIYDTENQLKSLIEHSEFWNIDFQMGESVFEILIKVRTYQPDLLVINEFNLTANDLNDFINQILRISEKNENLIDILLVCKNIDELKMANLLQAENQVLRTNLPLNISKLFNNLINRRNNRNFQNFVKEELKLPSNTNDKNFSDKCILIAEDVPMNMILIKEVIKGIFSEIKIIEVKNGVEAIDAVLNNNIDIVLMDVQMPVLDGIDATRKLREINNRQFESLPIIALTAGALAEEKQRVLDCGMNEFLTKPIIKSQLFEVLNKYL